MKRIINRLLVLLLLTGFGAAAWSQTTSPVRLGWVKSTSNLTAFESTEAAKQFGFTVEASNFNTAVDISTALVSGQLDVGLLTPVHMLRAIESGAPLVQISGNTRGGTSIIVAAKHGVKKGDWAAFQALVKQTRLRVASSRGSIQEILSFAELAANGIDATKYLDVVNIANFAQHPQALRSGQFDVIFTLEPLASMSVADGSGSLFSNPYNTPAKDLSTVYVARKQWLERNPALAQKFVDMIQASAEKLSNDKAYELATSRKMTGSDEAILRSALANTRYETSNGREEIKALADISAKLRYSERRVSNEDIDRAIDDQYVERARRANPVLKAQAQK